MIDLRSAFFLIFTGLLANVGAHGTANAAENSLNGLWQTEDKDGIVEFYPCGDQYCGRFYWLKVDSAQNPSLDFRNPDPALKTRPLCGMTFLGGYTDKGGGHYDGGWIYSPRHGSKFGSMIDLKENDTLELRGYIFHPWLGGTQVWARVKQAQQCDLLVKK